MLALGRPGGDLLFRALRRSTIGAEGFHGRVRKGIGCWAPRYDHQVVEASGEKMEERKARFRLNLVAVRVNGGLQSLESAREAEKRSSRSSY